MEFKVNLALFKATEDSLKARYGDKYDPSKKYPQYNGTMQVTQMDIVKMVNYLQKAEPEVTDYHPEGAVTVRASAYINTCLLYTSPSPRDVEESRMPSSA